MLSDKFFLLFGQEEKIITLAQYELELLYTILLNGGIRY
jgi:hypothetical protein